MTLQSSRNRSSNGSRRSSVFGPVSPVAAAIGVAVLTLAIAAAWLLWPEGEAEAAFVPVDSLEYEHRPNHLHGIGYDPANERLYLASHFGLFALEDEQLYQVGTERSDFMGFSMNPQDASEIFVSGHPQGGGNLGVLHSVDEGLTYDQIFTGIADEVVDFHSMTISAADPDWFYGAFMGYIYRSTDRGHSFEAVAAEGIEGTGLCWGVPCLAADSGAPDRVYAGMPDGLMVSHDGAETWSTVNDQIGQVAAVKVDPSNPDRIVAYTQAMGLAISTDGGQNWSSHNGNLDVGDGGFVFAIALNASDDQHMFVATMNNEVFETTNGGSTWTKVA